MICFFLEQTKKKYLEIILDYLGCNQVINNISMLRSKEKVRINVSKHIDVTLKQGYKIIKSVIIIYCSDIHIANTDYNIKFSLVEPSDVEILVTSEGIQELQEIIEYVRDNDDHFHLFADYDLYTGEEDYPSNNFLGAITIYNRNNYELT